MVKRVTMPELGRGTKIVVICESEYDCTGRDAQTGRLSSPSTVYRTIHDINGDRREQTTIGWSLSRLFTARWFLQVSRLCQKIIGLSVDDVRKQGAKVTILADMGYCEYKDNKSCCKEHQEH